MVHYDQLCNEVENGGRCGEGVLDVVVGFVVADICWLLTNATKKSKKFDGPMEENTSALD